MLVVILSIGLPLNVLGPDIPSPAARRWPEQLDALGGWWVGGLVGGGTRVTTLRLRTANIASIYCIPLPRPSKGAPRWHVFLCHRRLVDLALHPLPCKLKLGMKAQPGGLLGLTISTKRCAILLSSCNLYADPRLRYLPGSSLVPAEHREAPGIFDLF